MELILGIRIRFFHPRFRQWIELEERKEAISKAAADKKDEFPELIYRFLFCAIHVNPQKIKKLYWEKVIGLYILVCMKLSPTCSLPILQPTTQKHEPEIWDYPERAWNAYSHLLASSYGWSLKYIANLSVKDALGHIQEILLEKQMEREFLWSMSEASVSYEAQSKTSKPNPLPRPEWMKSSLIQKAPIKRMKILRSLLPVGNVDYSAVDDETKPKEIES